MSGAALHAAVLLPAIAIALWVGLGALISHLVSAAGERLPRLTWPGLGLAAMVVLSNTLSSLKIVLPFNGIIIVALALAGLFLERRALVPSPRQALLLAVAVGPIVVMFLGGLIISGPTITGYLADTNTGVHALGADFLVHHGADFKSIVPSTTDQAMITRFFVASSYPTGAHALFGMLGALSGLSLLWVNTPLMVLGLIVTAVAVMTAARGLGVPPLLAALAGVIISCGALTVSFALTGQLKELTALPVLSMMTVFAVHPQLVVRRRQSALVIAVLCAALYAILGIAAVVWCVAFAGHWLLGVILDRRQQGVPVAQIAKTVVIAGAAALVIGVVLSAPEMPKLAEQLTLAKNLSQSNAGLAADPGNLRGPIGKIQSFGIWISGDHRYPPVQPSLNWALIGAAVLLALIGAIDLLRRRRWMSVIWLAGLGVLWILLTARGTMWLDSKLVALNAPIVVLMMALGAAAVARRFAAPLSVGADAGVGGPSAAAPTALAAAPRLDWLLAAVVLAPVLLGAALSDVKLFRGTTTASYGRYQELAAIDKQYAGRGPALFTEFDEYAMYTMRNMHMVGDGNADSPGLTKSRIDGSGVGYGASLDVDSIAAPEVDQFPLVVTMRGPTRSSPGSGYVLARRGYYFDVWKRDPAALAKVIRHVPVGATASVALAFAQPSCRLADKLVSLAQSSGGHLVARVTPTAPTAIAAAKVQMTPDWAASFAASTAVVGSGRLTVPVPRALQGTDQILWLEGVVGRRLAVTAGGGKSLGVLPRLAAGTGSAVGQPRIPAGTTSVNVESTVHAVRFGDTSPTILGRFIFQSPTTPAVETLPATAESAKTLCSQSVDWIDIVRS